MSDEWNMQDAYTRQKSKIIRARKPRARRRVVICSHQADSPLYVGLVSDLVICKFRKKVWPYMTPNIFNETRCH